MRNAMLLGLAGVMVLAQWIVPWWTIHRNEHVLREGEPFLFRTAPIDPHDPFRGEYVTLSFAVEAKRYVHPVPGDTLFGDQRAYAILGKNQGEAVVERVVLERPTDGTPFLDCTFWRWGMEPDSVTLRLPFDRFYLEEDTGLRTEELINERNWGEGPQLPAYALVRVLDGEAVIEDLIVGDRPLREWVE